MNYTEERYTRIDMGVLFTLQTHSTQVWRVYSLVREVMSVTKSYASYSDVRLSVTRLRDKGIPILNRGSASGPWYVPRRGQIKWVREDIAARRKVGAGWNARTDIMENSSYDHLQVAEEINNTLVSV